MHICKDLGDVDLLDLRYRGNLYTNLLLPLDAFFFSKLRDAIRYIMNNNGHNALISYIGDLIYCGLPSKIHKAYHFY